MNTTPKMSVVEENTQRLIEQANRLGYTVVTIDTTGNLAIEVRPSSHESYTPALYQDWTSGEWTVQPPLTVRSTWEGLRKSSTATSGSRPWWEN